MTYRGNPFTIVAGGCLLLWAAPAHAATTCELDTQGDRWVLEADCETDETLVVPEGMTLDGHGHRITAVDPPDDHFRGAVVRNGGTVAHVRDVIIDTRNLANVCDDAGPPDDRLRGILLESASGSIVGNQVLDVRQEQSGCDEGHAIEARNPPYDGSHPDPQHVYIAGNRVEGYQKTGILALGDVQAKIYLNRVVGLGPIGNIAQNGIQIGRGATGQITLNHVKRNLYTEPSYAATGILLLEGDSDIEVTLNRVRDCDVGIRMVQTDQAAIVGNHVQGSTYDGITADGADGSSSGHRIVANRVSGGEVGIDLFGMGASGNVVRANRVSQSATAGIQLALDAGANWLHRNRIVDGGSFGIWVGSDDNGVVRNRVRGTQQVGLHVEGERNHVARNRVRASGELDIENVGMNEYRRNRCGSSSGPPVDCP